MIRSMKNLRVNSTYLYPFEITSPSSSRTQARVLRTSDVASEDFSHWVFWSVCTKYDNAK